MSLCGRALCSSFAHLRLASSDRRRAGFLSACHWRRGHRNNSPPKACRFSACAHGAASGGEISAGGFRTHINPDVSRSGLNRLLQREGLGSLRANGEETDATARKKGFKEYEPGFIHVDTKYLPKMPEETSRRYLFVAIDRASRWVFLHISERATVAKAKAEASAI
jgi:hypothetical protein